MSNLLVYFAVKSKSVGLTVLCKETENDRFLPPENTTALLYPQCKALITVTSGTLAVKKCANMSGCFFRSFMTVLLSELFKHFLVTEIALEAYQRQSKQRQSHK